MTGQVLAVVLLAAVGQAGASGGGMPSGPLSARVGEWVTYRLAAGGEGPASFWRMAVVGEERDNRGREAVWIEMELGQQRELAAPLAQWRVLVARQVGLSAEGVTRLQVALGFDRPREVSPDALPAFFGAAVPPPPASSARSGAARLREGAPVPLMTPAGTLSARPVELLLGSRVVRRLWLSAAVPVLGLARLEVSGVGPLMEVEAFGTDATPRMAPPAPEAPQIRLER
jgi:hypothetical protein